MVRNASIHPIRFAMKKQTSMIPGTVLTCWSSRTDGFPAKFVGSLSRANSYPQSHASTQIRDRSAAEQRKSDLGKRSSCGTGIAGDQCSCFSSVRRVRKTVRSARFRNERTAPRTSAAGRDSVEPALRR
eukprot:scaffold83_cov246-Pinguiococcus_pyrenoidosus.AAC.22